LVEHATLAYIKPSFKDDTNIVAIPPLEPAFSNCEKVVKRDVEVDRKKTKSICMHYCVRLANIESHNAQFSAAFKE
jgi:hypothetical protein